MEYDQERRELNNRMYAIQQEHIARSHEHLEKMQEHLDTSVANITVLRNELFDKIDGQTKEMEENAARNRDDIKDSCKTGTDNQTKKQVGQILNILSRGEEPYNGDDVACAS